MIRLNITQKIWLSIGVFIAGFVGLGSFVEIEDLRAERGLRRTSEALFPAAQSAQRAASAFQRVNKGLNDAVLVQDPAALARPGEDGKQVVEILGSIASIPDLPASRARQAQTLAGSIRALVDEARTVYAIALADSNNMTPELQARLGNLNSRIEATHRALDSQGRQLSEDLRDQLRELQISSARQRWITLLVSIVILVVAGCIVNLTIRRSITAPILKAVTGLRNVTTASGQASTRMAQSGQSVARDAQEQAACIEETSASLKQIAATTEENASRAKNADQFMKRVKATAEAAAKGMEALTTSMAAISDSSRQVSDVLKSINEIAFHTNILALNAAVEAARAGQAGAGFSVVADQVRSLARRASEAASQSDIIVQQTIADVRAGVELVSVAHHSFQEVSSYITSGTDVVAQIALSTGEQAYGLSQMDKAIIRIETVTQKNAANSRKSAEAAAAVDAQVQTTRRYLEGLAAALGLENA